MNRWREITTIDEWNEVRERSAERPVLLLKHSTRCPVSANALREFEDYIENHPEAELDYVLVKVIESRPVSNRIAEDLGVPHASPQIFLIKDRTPYWNASHWAITTEHISAVVD
jgi:bacillithiol system protein YtxJ